MVATLNVVVTCSRRLLSYFTEMNLSTNIVDVFVKFGVGKRSSDDEFFKSNKIVSKMSERIGICDFDKNSPTVANTSIACQVPGCFLEFKNLVDYECHYNSVHRYTCCECRKNLPSTHLLDLHVSETHDSFFAVMAKKTPSYVCYLETCSSKFQDQKERMEHCIADHKFPPNFRFDVNTGKTHNKDRKKNQSRNGSLDKSESSMETDVNVPSNETEKPKMKSFNFCHSKVKAFAKPSKTKHSNNENIKSKLDSKDLLSDLKDSLPQC